LLEGAGADQPVPVVVITQAPILDSEEADARAAGAQLHRRFGKLAGYAAQVPAGSLRRLASLQGVLGVPDSEVPGANDLNYLTVGADPVIRSSRLSVRIEVARVTVAVVDSGVAAHPHKGGLPAGAEIVGHGRVRRSTQPWNPVAGIIVETALPAAFNRFASSTECLMAHLRQVLMGWWYRSDVAGIDWVLTLHRRVRNRS
jgi:hypothetical protein